MGATRTPAVFIHGLWLHAKSWNDWIELFREAGYEPTAPSWPGVPATIEEARAHPESISGHGITDAADHYAEIIRSLAAKPIVIGHSFGGLIAQNLLGGGFAPRRSPSMRRRSKGCSLTVFVTPGGLRGAEEPCEHQACGAAYR